MDGSASAKGPKGRGVGEQVEWCETFQSGPPTLEKICIQNNFLDVFQTSSTPFKRFQNLILQRWDTYNF